MIQLRNIISGFAPIYSFVKQQRILQGIPIREIIYLPQELATQTQRPNSERAADFLILLATNVSVADVCKNIISAFQFPQTLPNLASLTTLKYTVHTYLSIQTLHTGKYIIHHTSLLLHTESITASFLILILTLISTLLNFIPLLQPHPTFHPNPIQRNAACRDLSS
jgi:hypothetical protein